MNDHRPSRRLPILAVVVAAVAAWGLYLTFAGPRGPVGDLPRPSLADPGLGRAANGWTLEDLEGKGVNLDDYRGRPIFLNIWATWCPPCRMELPAIEKLASNPRLKDVAFLAVSDEDTQTLTRFVSEKKLRVPVLRAKGPPPEVFQTDGIPATFLIARDGRIASAEVGAAQWDHPDVVDFLARLATSDPSDRATP